MVGGWAVTAALRFSMMWFLFDLGARRASSVARGTAGLRGVRPSA